jgi:hypothetical protein
MTRMSYLSTAEFALLNNACIPIREGLGVGTYLVGSVTEQADYRDVDVRTIVPDEEFDALFENGGEHLWSLICMTIGLYLQSLTGLKVDYQIQRMTEANEKFPGSRHPLGMKARPYAGGGDATKF